VSELVSDRYTIHARISDAIFERAVQAAIVIGDSAVALVEQVLRINA
jgi:hypothetical protein